MRLLVTKHCMYLILKIENIVINSNFTIPYDRVWYLNPEGMIHIETPIFDDDEEIISIF